MPYKAKWPDIPARHIEVWNQLHGFEFDKPGAVDTFERKLKKCQRWSLRRTRRAIDEYWKFHFIRQVTGLEVAPSHAVDMVWHMHLQYTKSYWHALCRDILGKDVHHTPSDGTKVDKQRCGNIYLETLTYYRRFFGEPPRDIWPVPGMSGWAMLGYCMQDGFYRVSETVVRRWNQLGDRVGEALRHAPYPYH